MCIQDLIGALGYKDFPDLRHSLALVCELLPEGCQFKGISSAVSYWACMGPSPLLAANPSI